MTDRELLQQALDKFEQLWEIGIDAEYKVDLMPEIRALRAELAKPEQAYEEVQITPTAIWRWVREGNVYVSRLTQEHMDQFKQDLENSRKELATPEQEPVKCTCGYAIGHPLVTSCSCKPRKEWVGLTDEDVDWILGLAYADDMELIKTIEAKLKEKNGG
jgi:hypothetical protein